MATKVLKTSECGCTRFTLDCPEAAGMWEDAVVYWSQGKITKSLRMFGEYRAHKFVNTRPAVRAATV